MGGEDYSCKKPGQAIKCGTIIRLTHLESGRNLHSHNVRSPLSNQKEVSAYGTGDRKGDDGDNWKVMCNTNNPNRILQRNEKFKLMHIDTSGFLGLNPSAEFN